MCGIAAAFGLSNAASIVYDLLIQIQHRGQESAGIACVLNDGIHVFKRRGLVIEAIGNDVLRRFRGATSCIGHVRYSTTGSTFSDVEAQPMCVKDGDIEYALAFNGNIVNYAEIRRLLRGQYTFETNTDTEVILKLIHYHVRRANNFIDGVVRALRELRGSYSLVVLTKRFLLLARDPHGFKPLSYAVIDELNSVVSSSESSSVEVVLEGLLPDVKFEVREVRPNQILVFATDGDVISLKILDHDVDVTPCSFEYIYFARPDTRFNDRYVYTVRERLGSLLAEREDQDVDVVVPVPESGRIAAISYAMTLQRPLKEVLVKCRYLGRSFIMPPGLRERISRFGVVASEVEGRSVALVDDSLVRGTTLRRLVRRLHDLRCRVHVRIASPPIRYPCFMGIDFPTRGELIASNRSVEEVRAILGCDSLRYLSCEDLRRGIGLPSPCMACFTGEYPIEVDVSRAEQTFRRF